MADLDFIGSLEEQALKRKQFLMQLRSKKQEKDAGFTNLTSTSAEKPNLPLPADILIHPNEPDTAKDTTELTNTDVISKITNEIDTLKTPIIIEEIDLQNLAPRKPDWDLKRDVAKKLEILERRTQRAIAEIIRERLRSNEGQVDLQAVNAVGYSAQTGNS